MQSFCKHYDPITNDMLEIQKPFISLFVGTNTQTLILSEIVIKRSGESHGLVCIYLGFSIHMYAAWLSHDAAVGLQWMAWIYFNSSSTSYSQSVQCWFIISWNDSSDCSWINCAPWRHYCVLLNQRLTVISHHPSIYPFISAYPSQGRGGHWSLCQLS